VDGLRLVAKSKHRNSLFPTATDATFQVFPYSNTEMFSS